MAVLNIKKFPDDLYEQLRRRAKRENRSLSQEVVHLLQQALLEKGKRSLLDLRGLGRKHWEDTDAGNYIDRERSTWDED